MGFVLQSGTLQKPIQSAAECAAIIVPRADEQSRQSGLQSFVLGLLRGRCVCECSHGMDCIESR